MQDDELREQFARWAQPLQAARPPEMSVLRRRVRRRAIRQAAASATIALGVAAALIIVLPRIGQAGRPRPAVPLTTHTVRPQLQSPQPTPRGEAPSPQTPQPNPTSVGPSPGGVAPVSLAGSGVPPYVLLLAGRQPRVLNVATGQVTGQVSPPAGAQLLWAAAAADDRTFAVAAQAGQQIRFYLLHLDASGRPGPLTPLPVPALHLAQIYGMALTADAGKLAVAWQNQPAGPVTSHIAVTTLATGATRSWSSGQGGAGTLSWAGPATLAFNWQDARSDRSGIRLLDTATAGTSPLDSRLLIPGSTRTGTLRSPSLQLITQDGSTVIADMVGGPQLDQVAIARFSARTGQLQAVLVPAAPASHNPRNYCGALWASPEGSRLLTQCGATQYLTTASHTAPIASPRLLIPAGPVGWASTFAW
jgi:hypothetical protein